MNGLKISVQFYANSMPESSHNANWKWRGLKSQAMDEEYKYMKTVTHGSLYFKIVTDLD